MSGFIRQRQPQQQGDVRTTVTVVEQSADPANAVQQLTLSPEQPHEPRVRWSADTVDNELLGRHKSKCCCIYKKTKKWDEDSEESDSDCETSHCRGHVEKCFRSSGRSGGGDPGSSCPA